MKECPLFADIAQNDLFAMLGCINGKTQSFDKGQTIIARGDKPDKIGIVLDGQVQIARTDFYGNKSIIATIDKGHLFAETFACAQAHEMPVDVVATQNSIVLTFDINKILTPCHNLCSFHNTMIFNLLKVTANKNLLLNQKIEVTSKRTTRDKLMAYLLLVATKENSNSFCIPFDRQALADYLEVDRSGLSAEIGKLQKQGYIKCRKNKFVILHTDDV